MSRLHLTVIASVTLLGTLVSSVHGSLSAADVGWDAQVHTYKEAGLADAAETQGHVVSGVPRSLLAALAGVPEDGMPWGALARVELAPGARIPFLFGPGPVLYAVEGGEIVVRLAGSVRIARAIGVDPPGFREETLDGDGVKLGEGDRVLIDAGVVHGLRSTETTGATVLAATILPDHTTVSLPVGDDRLTLDMPLGVAMFRPVADGVVPPSWPAGVTVKTRATAEIISEPAIAAR